MNNEKRKKRYIKLKNGMQKVAMCLDTRLGVALKFALVLFSQCRKPNSERSDCEWIHRLYQIKLQEKHSGSSNIYGGKGIVIVLGRDPMSGLRV